MDIQELKNQSSHHIRSILQHYIPDGTFEGTEFVFRNPKRLDNEKNSCKFTISKMFFKDFSTGEGGDIFDLLQLINNWDLTKSIEELSEYLGTAKPPKEKRNESAVTVLGEIPPAPATSFRHFTHGEPIQVWEHKTIDNRLFGYICRYMTPNGKQDLPYYWGLVKKTMTPKYVFGAPKENKMLFGLETLSRIKSKSIIVVEGQKCQKALADFIPMPVITWIGGANAIKKANWEPIIKDGRNIILWPDNDEAGQKTISILSELLNKDISFLGIPDKHPKKWDSADAIQIDKFTKKQIKDFIISNKMTYTSNAFQLAAPEELPDITAPIEREDIPANEEPFEFLGYEGNKYYYFPEGLQQVKCYTPGEHNQNNLLELADLNYWEAKFPGAKGGCSWGTAWNWMLQSQVQKGIYKAENLRGRGVWQDNKQTVIHAGSHLIINNKNVPIRSHPSEYTYEKCKSLNMKFKDIATLEETKKLYDSLHKLSWERQRSALFLAGWIVIAPVAGSLGWRPHIWLTAGAGMGKSWVLGNVIKPLIGEHIHALGESTQAGLRQQTKNDSLPIIVDEFESNDKKGADRISGVLELSRQSSSESEASIFKGTLSHKAISFNPRSIFCFASIGLNIKEFADQTRITVLKLAKNKKPTDFPTIERNFYEMVNSEFKYSLMARTIKKLPIILENRKLINDFLKIRISQRLADQYSILYAGAWSLISDNVIKPNELNTFVGDLTTDDLQETNIESDELRCLELILESKLKVMNKEYSIAELISEVYEYCQDLTISPFAGNEPENKVLAIEAYSTLSRHGIRVDCRRSWKADGKYTKNIFIAGKHKELDKILENTAYQGKHQHYIERIPNSEKNIPVNFAGSSKRAIKIPYECTYE